MDENYIYKKMLSLKCPNCGEEKMIQVRHGDAQLMFDECEVCEKEYAFRIEWSHNLRTYTLLEK